MHAHAFPMLLLFHLLRLLGLTTGLGIDEPGARLAVSPLAEVAAVERVSLIATGLNRTERPSPTSVQWEQLE